VVRAGALGLVTDDFRKEVNSVADPGKPHKSRKHSYLHVDIGKPPHKEHPAVKSKLGAYAIWGTNKKK
jgi:hypothetical protein